MKSIFTFLSAMAFTIVAFSQVSNTDGILTADGASPWVPLTDQENLKQYANKINQFSFRLYSQAVGGQSDAFFSGYSAAQPIGAIAYASTGDVQQAILNLFFEEDPLVSGLSEAEKATRLGQMLKTVNVSIKNASDSEEDNVIYAENKAFQAYVNNLNHIYLQSGQTYSSSFISEVTRYLNATVQTEDFASDAAAATGRINALVSEQTQGLIPELFQNSLESNTLVVLLNTLYMHASWTKKLNEVSDQPFTFIDKNGASHQVEAVSNRSSEANIRYVKDNASYEAFAIPLRTKNVEPQESGYTVDNERDTMFEVLFIKPTGADFSSVKSNLPLYIDDFDTNAKHTHGLDEHEDKEKIQVTLPKFELTHRSEDLKQTLIQMGVPRDFTLANVIENRNGGVEVSKIIQEAKVKLDKGGIRAAAATGSLFSFTSLNSTYITGHINLDRPFFFFIRHAHSGLILFQGHIQTQSPMEPTTVNQTTVAGSSNHLPSINPIPDQEAFVGQPFTLQVTASDPDQRQTLTYKLKNNQIRDKGISIDQNTGVLTWTPNQRHRSRTKTPLSHRGTPHEVIVVVEDNNEASKGKRERTFTIRVLDSEPEHVLRVPVLTQPRLNISGITVRSRHASVCPKEYVTFTISGGSLQAGDQITYTTTAEGESESAAQQVTVFSGNDAGFSGNVAGFELRIASRTVLTLKQLQRGEESVNFPTGENAVSAVVEIKPSPALALKSGLGDPIRFAVGTVARQVIDSVVDKTQIGSGNFYLRIYALFPRRQASHPFRDDQVLYNGTFDYGVTLSSSNGCIRSVDGTSRLLIADEDNTANSQLLNISGITVRSRHASVCPKEYVTFTISGGSLQAGDQITYTTTAEGESESAAQQVTVFSGNDAGFELRIASRTVLTLKQLQRGEESVNFPTGENAVSAVVEIEPLPTLALKSGLGDPIRFAAGTVARQVIDSVVDKTQSGSGNFYLSTYALFPKRRAGNAFWDDQVLHNGTFDYGVTLFSSNGCSRSVDGTSRLLIADEETAITLNVEDELEGSQVDVFPTMTTDALNVQIENSATGKVMLRVINSSIQTVLQWRGVKNNQVLSLPLDISHLVPGLYLVEIVTENQCWTRKVLKR